MAGDKSTCRLPTWLLVLAPVAIWASTWHVILYQLDSGVPVLSSVGWRFAIASAVLAALARITAGPPGQTARAATSVTKTARPRSLPANPHQHFNVRAILPPRGECTLATPAD